MTAITPVERVSELLEGANYRRLPAPLSIAGLSFDIPAAFVGHDRASDLVLVADTAFEPAAKVLRKVEGVGRALDVLRSRRPVTLVLAGPRPEAEIVEALAKVCRVLPVGTQVDDDPATGLMNWLAVLLPLTLPEPSLGLADPLAAVRASADALDARVQALIDLAPQGADVVQASLHEMLTSTLDQREVTP